MADREKVMKGLECCRKGSMCSSHCPYDGPENDIENCTSQLARDALELLKEQEPLAVRMKDDFGAIKFGYCPKCGSILNDHDSPKSCGCGQAVKWHG